MAFAEQIGLDLDLLAQNIAKLQQQAASMPEPADVRQISGGNTEEAEQTFTAKLQSVAFILAQQVDVTRKFVSNNADALNAAAETLQGSDAIGTSAASTATSFIDGIVESTPATTGPTGGSSAPSSEAGSSTGASRGGTSGL